MKEELKIRVVKGPDGTQFEVDPLRDYFCEAAPSVHPPAYLKIVEDLFNWARAESIWILGFGTGCGAIEMRPLMTPRFDAYRFGVQWRPTPRTPRWRRTQPPRCGCRCRIRLASPPRAGLPASLPGRRTG